jgi:hypothetical protein
MPPSPVLSSSAKSNAAVNALNRSARAAAVPFDAVAMHTLLPRLMRGTYRRGEQQDAEEFLVALLNAMHDECLAVLSCDVDSEFDNAYAHIRVQNCRRLRRLKTIRRHSYNRRQRPLLIRRLTQPAAAKVGKKW